MQVLSFLSCVLTSLGYQSGYCGCSGSQRYHYGRWAMQLIFVAREFRLHRVQKRGKKEQKMKNCVLQKKLFYFCMFTSWTQFWGSMRIKKIAWGRCARQKNFLNFGNQLRCAISEISSYTLFEILDLMTFIYFKFKTKRAFSYNCCIIYNSSLSIIKMSWFIIYLFREDCHRSRVLASPVALATIFV